MRDTCVCDREAAFWWASSCCSLNLVKDKSLPKWLIGPLLVFLLMLAGCSGAGDTSAGDTSSDPNEELAVTSETAPLTRDQLINLATALTDAGDRDDQQIVIRDDLLRRLTTIHIRSSAVVEFLEAQEEAGQSVNLARLRVQTDEGIVALIDNEEILELEAGSGEFMALSNIILADRSSNPLRGELDPTGQPAVGDNPFTSSFVFDPTLVRNFNATRPGFLARFDDVFAEFTDGVMVASGLGVWNTESFSVTAPEVAADAE